jgi:hypothetical protein
MVKKVKQFRYYSEDNPNNNATKNEFLGKEESSLLKNCSPAIHLGVQTIPGTKIYINEMFEGPLIIGASGIYELDLENTTGLITDIKVDPESMNTIASIPTAYIIIDIVYEAEEE